MVWMVYIYCENFEKKTRNHFFLRDENSCFMERKVGERNKWITLNIFFDSSGSITLQMHLHFNLKKFEYGKCKKIKSTNPIKEKTHTGM